MRKMKVVRDCHGFRGGTWRKGEEVDVEDGEIERNEVPRHIVPIEEYEQALLEENRPKSRPDPMKPQPSILPIPAHLQGKGGMSTVKPDNFRPAPARSAGR